MGIQGLLTFVKAATSPIDVTQIRGKCVAVDAYCWLHKGAFGCADLLAQGQDSNAYVTYCLRYLDVLERNNIKVIMVFDGRHLPAKMKTEEKRAEQRKQARKQAIDCKRLGKIEEARGLFKKSLDISPKMAVRLIKECRKRHIDCIVAPYEADAQLAFLNKAKLADYVITEDSDLVLFGCDKIIFKFDMTGRGQLVDAKKLHLATGESQDKFSFDNFRFMCILSGCDYLDSLPGIGLKKARKFIERCGNEGIQNALPKLPRVLNMLKITVTPEYIEEFLVADATFKHQLVFDPLRRRLIPLTDPELCGTKPEHCRNAGQLFNSRVALQVALGNMDPFTFEILDNWNPDAEKRSIRSIWSVVDSMIEITITQINTQTISVTKPRNTTNQSKVRNEIINEDYEDKLLKIYRSPEQTQPSEKCSDEKMINHLTRQNTFVHNKNINPFKKTNLIKSELNSTSSENICEGITLESQQNKMKIEKIFDPEKSDKFDEPMTLEDLMNLLLKTKIIDNDEQYNEESNSKKISQNLSQDTNEKDNLLEKLSKFDEILKSLQKKQEPTKDEGFDQNEEILESIKNYIQTLKKNINFINNTQIPEKNPKCEITQNKIQSNIKKILELSKLHSPEKNQNDLDYDPTELRVTKIQLENLLNLYNSRNAVKISTEKILLTKDTDSNSDINSSNSKNTQPKESPTTSLSEIGQKRNFRPTQKTLNAFIKYENTPSFSENSSDCEILDTENDNSNYKSKDDKKLLNLMPPQRGSQISRISKFQPTLLNEKTVVRSNFFASATITSSSQIIESQPQINDLNSVEQSDDTIGKYCDNDVEINASSSNKRNFNEVNCNDICDTKQESKKMCLKQFNYSNKKSTCRRPGLSKIQNRVPQNQPTLFNMFAYKKK